MATSTRITRSKGESDGLSLPMTSRSTRRDATSGRNGGTTLSTSGREHQQQMPTQTPHLTQSQEAVPVERTATAPMLPPGLHRPLTPRMPLPTLPASSLSSSAPLFQEDGYSSASEEESEVTFTHGRCNGTSPNQHAKRTSTPTPSDYATQGNPDASPPSSSKTHDINNEFLGTNNFFVPDGSDRRIHQIQNKVFHAGYLDNGNNAYLLELPALENMLNTRKFLMDEMSGQFYAVYGKSYQRMLTKPMLQWTWAMGELIDELAATRQAFGYTGLTGSTPPLAMGTQPTASTLQQPDDLLPRQPTPKTVQYQPPSFRLTRPTTCLTRNERIQVHHNYISAVSSLEHKKDLLNRLKRSDTCNIPAYEAEMSRHMTLHEDVIERVLNILKQDDYYRTLEDLPVIDELTAYDDIKLFPELYDMSTIIEGVTTEADLIERQLKQSGMYPQHTDLSQNTPNLPKTNPQPAPSNNSRNSLPQSLLPCGQRTLAASTSSSDAPSTPTQHASPNPQKHTPSKTNINPSSQSFITGEDHKCVPKSADGTRVKRSKQQHRQPDERLCFHCNLPGHLKRYCPKIPYCSICRTKGHTQDKCMNRPQKTRRTHPAGETRDQQKKKDNLAQSSSRVNMCLQYRGDHHTTNCTRRQSPSINASTTGTGIPPHQHAPNNSRTSVNNSQSPTTQTETTLHVRTPTLNINAPPFPPNLHQAPLPPHANRPNNFHTNQHTHMPSHTFSTQFPPPFNPHVPPPYFPQYPATTSPPVHSSDSSILLALQKQWELQERLDMECNQMEKEKEEKG